MASILFGDLVNFTAWSAARDPEDVRELQDAYFVACERIVERYGGTVEKFIGDAVMAVWGAPTAQEDDAERAVRAGLELVAAVATLGTESGLPSLALRVGVVTGEVAVTVGASNQGLVAGDAVNTAARIQSIASPGQVWVDDRTRLLTTAAITYAGAGRHLVKGKADWIAVWVATAAVPAVARELRADGLEAPLVGRDRDLRLAEELFHQCEESERPLLLVVDGEAGVGKSRLGRELETYADSLSTTVRWHRTRCVAYGEGVAYLALSEAVRGRLQEIVNAQGAVSASDHLSRPRADETVLLDEGLDRLIPDVAERDWMRPRISALLGHSSIGSFTREDLYSSWLTFFERVGDGDPVALLVDDAQHADEGLLSFVEHVLSTGSTPFFLMLLTRPGLLEAHPSLVHHRRTNVVRLGTLRDREMEILVDGLVSGLSDDVRRLLVARAEGLPLFAVETVRGLVDREVVVPRDGRYVVASPDAVHLRDLDPPPTLRALLAARLDALEPDQRRLVDRASVLGEVFTLAGLEAVCPGTADLPSLLSDLVSRQIFAVESSRLSSDYGHYRFVQASVRQTAYDMLSRRDRRALHLAVVDHLDRSDDVLRYDAAAIRAEHYLGALESASDVDDGPRLRSAARDNLVMAGQRSTDLSVPSEAVRHLRKAMDLADEAKDRARIGLLLAEALTEADRYAEAYDVAETSCRTFVDLGLRAAAGRAAAAAALAVFVPASDLDVGRRAFSSLKPWWDELQDGHDHDVLLVGRAMCRMYNWVSDWSGDTTDVHRAFTRTTRLAESLDDVDGLLDCVLMLGTYYAHVGLPTPSRAMHERGLSLAQEHHRPGWAARVAIDLMTQLTSYDLGRCDELVPLLREAPRFCNAHTVGFTRTVLASHAWARGIWSELDSEGPSTTKPVHGHHVDRVLRAALLSLRDEARGVPIREPDLDDEVLASEPAIAQLVRCVGLASAGREAAAVATGVEMVQDWATRIGLWSEGFLAWGWVSTLALRVGDLGSLDTLLRIVRSDCPIPLALRAQVAQVEGLRAARTGRAEAEGHLRRAVTLMERWDSAPYLARARADLARWCLEHGLVEEGEALVTQARATYDELGATGWAAELPLTAPDRGPR